MNIHTWMNFYSRRETRYLLKTTLRTESNRAVTQKSGRAYGKVVVRSDSPTG